jgi:Mg-chelatase subunit ChlI
MSESYQPEYFEKGPLTKAMEGGGILYIEEFNRMPADVSNVLISPITRNPNDTLAAAHCINRLGYRRH